MNKKISLTLLVVAGISVSAPSFAVEAARNTMESKMSIPQTCRITSVQDVDFGAYTGARLRKTMAVGFRCNKSTTLLVMAIKMDCGKNGVLNAGVCTRKMKNTNEAFATNFLEYEVYKDSSYSQKLDTTGQVYSYTLAGAVSTHTFYNQLPASQFTSAYGSYADDVTVTVTF